MAVSIDSRENCTNRSITEIALANGFNNPSHFSRVFPRAFRSPCARCKARGRLGATGSEGDDYAHIAADKTCRRRVQFSQFFCPI